MSAVIVRRKKNLTAPEWKIRWVEVTKPQATKWLSKSHLNRTLNESVADAYRRVMESGLWDTRPSQSPIAIDKQGNLINGQHRLQGFVNSKLTAILLPVIYDCDPEDFRLFDQDIYVRSRAAQFRDRTFVTRDMARVRALEVLQTGDVKRRVPNSLFESLADGAYRAELDWAREAFPDASDQQRAPFVAAFMYAYRVDPKFTAEIAKPWINGGAGLPAAMLRLRDEAIRNGRGGTWAAMNESLRMLAGLMFMHQKRDAPRALSATHTGLNYWSALAKDGVSATWAKRGEE